MTMLLNSKLNRVLSQVLIALVLIFTVGCDKNKDKESELVGSAPYTPLFFEPSSNAHTTAPPEGIYADYQAALNSENVDTAIRRWSEFLKAHHEKQFADAPQARMVKFAQYEMIRLNYIKGETKVADELLIKDVIEGEELFEGIITLEKWLNRQEL